MARLTKGAVLAVVGAQWGSEGKGTFIHHIANQFGVHVRTGGPDAGHTFVQAGRKWTMQAIPSGWTNPEALCYIGRGGLVDPRQLVNEISTVYGIDPTIRHRLIIDSDCGVVSSWHEAVEGGALLRRIGDAGRGIGAARQGRIHRDPETFKRIKDVVGDYRNEAQGWALSEFLQPDTSAMLNQFIDKGVNVLLEGTQGSGLSLIHGPWPYTTSHDTNAAQLAADAGIPPQYVETLLVARTYPVRRGGLSGPLKNETTWGTISKRVGRPVVENHGNKPLRIGAWDEDLLESAVRLNGASQVAISFMDYLDPASEGVSTPGELADTARNFVQYVSHRFKVNVPFVGTGGENYSVVELKPLSLAHYTSVPPALPEFGD